MIQAYRNTDPVTSRMGSRDVKYRKGSQKARLLEVYKAVSPGALSDEQAADLAGLNENPLTCWWKRCSELRADGMIEVMPSVMVKSSAGSMRMVCKWVNKS